MGSGGKILMCNVAVWLCAASLLGLTILSGISRWKQTMKQGRALLPSQRVPSCLGLFTSFHATSPGGLSMNGT
ncbi:hypothetical protein J3E69DRAFT_329159 [Trichoderma sp. SZMC 28015]